MNATHAEYDLLAAIYCYYPLKISFSLVPKNTWHFYCVQVANHSICNAFMISSQLWELNVAWWQFNF